MEVSAQLVKELREKTGVSMMECKKALVASNGNFEDAVKYLREKGISLVAKKADREANEGRVFTYISSDMKKGVILEISCETDFVAKSDDFINFGTKLAEMLSNSNFAGMEAVLSLVLDGKSVQNIISDLVLKLGENINIKRVEKVEAQGIVSNYVHSNGKIGVLVDFETEIDVVLAKDIAMHIAAMNPLYLKPEQVPAEEINKEKEIIKAQAINEGKPANVADKIVEGRLNKFFQEVCLLEQEFVKEKATVKSILKNHSIKGFFRYSF
ncbi:MAG: translation elongation factor Ts [Candidatus Margulisiibacteriota bacterium]|jgi:elongation factor Ts